MAEPDAWIEHEVGSERTRATGHDASEGGAAHSAGIGAAVGAGRALRRVNLVYGLYLTREGFRELLPTYQNTVRSLHIVYERKQKEQVV